MADDGISITHNHGRKRYEIHVEDELAGVLDYRDREGVLDLYHTGVEPQFGGRGLGARIVEFALTEARDSVSKVIPTCSFVAGYLGKHPEFSDVVA